MTLKIYQIIQNCCPRHSLNKWLTYFEANNNFKKMLQIKKKIFETFQAFTNQILKILEISEDKLILNEMNQLKICGTLFSNILRIVVWSKMN